MNNKKTIIIVILVILVVCAIGFGIFKATHNENYLYNQDGTIRFEGEYLKGKRWNGRC